MKPPPVTTDANDLTNMYSEGSACCVERMMNSSWNTSATSKK